MGSAGNEDLIEQGGKWGQEKDYRQKKEINEVAMITYPCRVTQDNFRIQKDSKKEMCGGQVDDNHKERQSMGEADAKWMDQRKGGLTAAGGKTQESFG